MDVNVPVWLNMYWILVIFFFFLRFKNEETLKRTLQPDRAQEACIAGWASQFPFDADGSQS